MEATSMVRPPLFCSNRLLVRAVTSASTRPAHYPSAGAPHYPTLVRAVASASTRPAQDSADDSALRHPCIQFRPCIDIHQGKVKQIVGSTLCDHPGVGESLVTNFVTEKSAAEFAQLYHRDGLFGGHVVMLGSDEASEKSAIDAINAFPGGLQVGGGVTPNNANKYLDHGASHVIVTSFIFTDGKLDLKKLEQLVRVVGKQRLVVDLSCRKVMHSGDYAVVTHRWQKFTDFIISKGALESLSHYADEFLVHGVDVEGKRLGVDEELVSLLGQWSPIPVTYAGGVSSLADLEVICVAGRGVVNVTVGSALDIFGGELPYSQVVQWHKRQENGRAT